MGTVRDQMQQNTISVQFVLETRLNGIDLALPGHGDDGDGSGVHSQR